MSEDLKKQTYVIKDHIGVFDNFMDPNTCDKLVEWFNQKESFHQTYNRLMNEDIQQHVKHDWSVDINENTFHTLFKGGAPDTFAIAMNNVFKLYDKETNIMKYISVDELHWDNYKIQKTPPAGGYHIWHVEQNPSSERTLSRVLVFTVYLNDINEGGETEFLLQSQRVAPKKGRVCVFPAYFPFVHRGNPPLKEDKYIATGWLYGSPITS